MMSTSKSESHFPCSIPNPALLSSSTLLPSPNRLSTSNLLPCLPLSSSSTLFPAVGSRSNKVLIDDEGFCYVKSSGLKAGKFYWKCR